MRCVTWRAISARPYCPVLLEKDNAEVFDSIIELLYRTPLIEVGRCTMTLSNPR